MAGYEGGAQGGDFGGVFGQDAQNGIWANNEFQGQYPQDPAQSYLNGKQNAPHLPPMTPQPPHYPQNPPPTQNPPLRFYDENEQPIDQHTPQTPQTHPQMPQNQAQNPQNSLQAPQDYPHQHQDFPPNLSKQLSEYTEPGMGAVTSHQTSLKFDSQYAQQPRDKETGCINLAQNPSILEEDKAGNTNPTAFRMDPVQRVRNPTNVGAPGTNIMDNLPQTAREYNGPENGNPMPVSSATPQYVPILEGAPPAQPAMPPQDSKWAYYPQNEQQPKEVIRTPAQMVPGLLTITEPTRAPQMPPQAPQTAEKVPIAKFTQHFPAPVSGQNMPPKQPQMIFEPPRQVQAPPVMAQAPQTAQIGPVLGSPPRMSQMPIITTTVTIQDSEGLNALQQSPKVAPRPVQAGLPPKTAPTEQKPKIVLPKKTVYKKLESGVKPQNVAQTASPQPIRYPQSPTHSPKSPNLQNLGQMATFRYQLPSPVLHGYNSLEGSDTNPLSQNFSRRPQTNSIISQNFTRRPKSKSPINSQRGTHTGQIGQNRAVPGVRSVSNGPNPALSPQRGRISPGYKNGHNRSNSVRIAPNTLRGTSASPNGRFNVPRPDRVVIFNSKVDFFVNGKNGQNPRSSLRRTSMGLQNGLNGRGLNRIPQGNGINRNNFDKRPNHILRRDNRNITPLPPKQPTIRPNGGNVTPATPRIIPNRPQNTPKVIPKNFNNQPQIRPNLSPGPREPTNNPFPASDNGIPANRIASFDNPSLRPRTQIQPKIAQKPVRNYSNGPRRTSIDARALPRTSLSPSPVNFRAQISDKIQTPTYARAPSNGGRGASKTSQRTPVVSGSPGSPDYRVERVPTPKTKFSKIELDREGNVLRHEELSSRVMNGLDQALVNHPEYARYHQKNKNLGNSQNWKNRGNEVFGGNSRRTRVSSVDRKGSLGGSRSPYHQKMAENPSTAPTSYLPQNHTTALSRPPLSPINVNKPPQSPHTLQNGPKSGQYGQPQYTPITVKPTVKREQIAPERIHRTAPPIEITSSPAQAPKTHQMSPIVEPPRMTVQAPREPSIDSQTANQGFLFKTNTSIVIDNHRTSDNRQNSKEAILSQPSKEGNRVRLEMDQGPNQVPVDQIYTPGMAKIVQNHQNSLENENSRKPIYLSQSPTFPRESRVSATRSSFNPLEPSLEPYNNSVEYRQLEADFWRDKYKTEFRGTEDDDSGKKAVRIDATSGKKRRSGTVDIGYNAGHQEDDPRASNETDVEFVVGKGPKRYGMPQVYNRALDGSRGYKNHFQHIGSPDAQNVVSGQAMHEDSPAGYYVRAHRNPRMSHLYKDSEIDVERHDVSFDDIVNGIVNVSLN